MINDCSFILNYMYGFIILVLGESLLNVIGCLVPFLEYDLLDTLPLTVASALGTFSKSLHGEIIQLLCTNLLPSALGTKSTRRQQLLVVTTVILLFFMKDTRS